MKVLSLLTIILFAASCAWAQKVNWDKPLYRIRVVEKMWLSLSDYDSTNTIGDLVLRDTTARYVYSGDTVFCFEEYPKPTSINIYDSLGNIIQKKKLLLRSSEYYTENYTNYYDGRNRLIKSVRDDGYTVEYRYRRKFINERVLGNGKRECTKNYFSDKEYKRKTHSIWYYGLQVPRETRYEYDSQGRLICSEFDFPDGLGSSYYKYYYYNNIKIVEHFEIDYLELYAFVYEVE